MASYMEFWVARCGMGVDVAVSTRLDSYCTGSADDEMTVVVRVVVRLCGWVGLERVCTAMWSSGMILA